MRLPLGKHCTEVNHDMVVWVLTNISDEVLWSLATVDKVLRVVIVRVGTLRTLYG